MKTKFIIVFIVISISTFAQNDDVSYLKKNTTQNLHFQSTFDTIKDFKSIKVLNFHNMKLSEIPHEVFQCINLEVLDLSFNEIKDIPAKIVSLKHLKKLYLNKNQLQTIPKELYEMSLEVLMLNENNHSFLLPEGIEKCNTLKALYVSDLKFIPLGIWKLYTLENLRLWNSGLTSIPDDIINFENLREICLRNNSISSISNNFYNLKHLEYISLGDNQINNISDRINNFKNVNYLALFSNPLADIPIDSTFITKLEFLSIWQTNISNNRIEQIRMINSDLKIYVKKDSKIH